MNPWDTQSERIYQNDSTWHSLNANSKGGQSRDAVLTFRKTGHPQNAEDPQGYEKTDTADTLNCTDNSESRTPVLCYQSHGQDARYTPMGETSETVTQKYGTGGNNTPLVAGFKYSQGADAGGGGVFQKNIPLDDHEQQHRRS